MVLGLVLTAATFGFTTLSPRQDPCPSLGPDEGICMSGSWQHGLPFKYYSNLGEPFSGDGIFKFPAVIGDVVVWSMVNFAVLTVAGGLKNSDHKMEGPNR